MLFRRSLCALAVLTACAGLGLVSMSPLGPDLAMAAAASPLGDLSAFRTIAVDTEALVIKGDLAGAKARIKDLETAWDEGESTLYPRSKSDWTELDKSIDIALAALRAKPQDPKRCETALTKLLATIDALSGATG